MDVIYGLIPGMLILGLLMVGILFWAARSGQFDDLEGDAYRMLMDDELEPKKPGQGEDAKEGAEQEEKEKSTA